MRKIIRSGILASILVLLALSCASRMPAPANPQSVVILISVDGYRADYFERYPSATLATLAADGIRAESLTPSYPSKTFPNHYTIVTGLYPAHHGIVANVMYDPEYDETFSMSKRKEVENARWGEGEPVWVTAELQGVPAATYFWPGSEAPIKGIRPTFWKRYDGSVSGEARVDEVLSWLDLEPGVRPRFITLYFSDVDSQGHRFGPASAEVQEAIQQVDGYLGRLVSGIRERGLEENVNLIIVSDHGMAATDDEKLIFLDDYLSLDEIQLIDTTPVAMMNGKGGNTEAVFQKLKQAHPALHAYRAPDYPADWNWEGHRRIPEIAAMADEGWTIVQSRRAYEGGEIAFFPGAHGYEHWLTSMGGLFVANGPAFAAGKTVEPFQNIHIYALLAHILDLEPAQNDGDLSEVEHLLK